MWDQLYNSLDVRLRPKCQRLPLPNDSDLDRFEQEHGHTLPASYRDFIKVFGAGELGAFFSIKGPGYSRDASLEDFNRLMHIDDEREAKLANQPIKRFAEKVYFASVNGGEIVAWDVGDVRKEEPREYGVYLQTRDARFLELAPSFEQFITEVCLRTGLDPAWKKAGFVVEDRWPIHRVFVPEQSRQEK
ncbi:MAG: SMI1/KNR4 family protein [Planctomycetaceae bacterium]|nr:SMI1/KNR4 family protein [Planctomycetaceae bacterium]